MSILIEQSIHLSKGDKSQTFEFSIDDAALSIRVSAVNSNWTTREQYDASDPIRGRCVFGWDFEYSEGETILNQHRFGCEGTDPARNPFSRYTLNPGINRVGRIVFFAEAEMDITIRVENSITIGSIGTPAQGFGATDTTSIDWGSASDRALFGWLIRNNRPIATFTFNLVAASGTIGEATNGGHASSARRWVAADTSGGTHDLVFVTTGDSQYSLVGVPATGVDQTTPTSSPVTNTGTGSPMASAAVTSQSGDLAMAGIMSVASGGGTSITITDTAIYESDSQAGIQNAAISTKAGAASVTLDYTGTAIDVWCVLAFNIKAGGAAPPATGGASNKITRGVKLGIGRGMN